MLLLKRGPQLSHPGFGVQSGSEGGAMSARSSQPESSLPPGLSPQSLDVHFEDNVNPPSEREFTLDSKDNPWLADEFETVRISIVSHRDVTFRYPMSHRPTITVNCEFHFSFAFRFQ